jgi:hypothetical protein
LQVNVLSLTVPKKLLRTWLNIFASLLLAIVAVLSLKEGRISAQDLPSIIGRIEGDDLEVATTTPTGVETNAAPTVVASGSQVTLRSGRALLLLDAGGEISVCGPARFKLIKSGEAVTLALDYGRVHPSFDSAETFTIYTPTIIATPIAISGGPRDTTVGLDQSGEMCVLTAHGAMRVEPQFSDQSLIVPQGGAASLIGGQIESLHSDVSACACDFPRARLERPRERPRPSPRPEISALSHPLQPERPKTDESPQPAAPATEPVYTVLMPPITFDANSPAPPPDPSPETILLVREVRLRPSVAFHGHVNPAPAPEPAGPSPETPVAPAPKKNIEVQHAKSQPGILDRMRNFFRRWTGKGPCAGSGCTD